MSIEKKSNVIMAVIKDEWAQNDDENGVNYPHIISSYQYPDALSL